VLWSFETIMTTRHFLSSAILLSALSPMAAMSALAETDDRSRVEHDFKVLNEMAQLPADHDFRLGSVGTVDDFRLPKLRASWTYRLVEGGPVLELGALGGGRKGTPKLAHVRVNWRF
jgi:hypothetical protein